MIVEPPTADFVTVIEDTELNQVVGSATMVIERKFIHKCATVNR